MNRSQVIARSVITGSARAALPATRSLQSCCRCSACMLVPTRTARAFMYARYRSKVYLGPATPSPP
ncbi:MAG: hypothetical protein U0169_27015 [Polyangiaceae bacterium]